VFRFASPWFAVSVILLLLAPPAHTLGAQTEPSTEKKDEKKEELPLKPESTIEFTTHEGTWMSLDVSKDGQTIVFDLLGDLYTLPIGGGEARRIFGDMSFESQPRFSPDGTRIVFLSDRGGAENVWIANADGSNPKALTTGRNQRFTSPSWSPDGNYVVVSRVVEFGDVPALWIYHVDGGTGVLVGPPNPPMPSPENPGPPVPRPTKMGAVFSPDARFVYFAQRAGNREWAYNAQFPAWQIVRYDRDNGEMTTITNAMGSAMRPLLSPDGKLLVYATRHDTKTGLRLRDLATGTERWLLYPVTRDDQESRGTRDLYPGYAFMPDGKSLIVPIDGKIRRVNLANGATTLIPFSATIQAGIGPRVHSDYRVDDSPTLRARLVRWPVLSPDGKRLAFSALNKLWLMDIGGTPKRLTTASHGEFMPTWSRDGRYVTYVSWSEEEGGHIWRVAADGSAVTERLTRQAGWYSEPVYNPDGSKIVFLAGSSDDQLYSELRQPKAPDTLEEGEVLGLVPSAPPDLRWIPADGGDSVYIASSAGGAGLHFGAEHDRVYMTTFGGLASIRLDGQDRRTVVKVTGTPMFWNPAPTPADDIRVSPDGQRLLVNLQNKIYSTSLPKAGREVVSISIAAAAPASLPYKRLSLEGGDYLQWTADGKAATWAWGARVYKHDLQADKSEVSDVVIDVPRARPHGSVVLRGARVITMKGDEVIEKADLVVTDNRIAAVGPRGRVTVPPGARVIDATGKTIIPGFVDVHAHMWGPRSINQKQIWQYLANLAYGVTTTRDPQSSTNDVFAYTDLVDTGEILGPRVYSTGPGVFAMSGLDDLDATRAFIKRYKEAYRTTTLKQYMSGDRIVRQWVAMACKEYGITPTTEGALDMKLDLSQMIDGFSGNEHALPIQPLYKDVTTFVARTRTYYTPTLLVAYGAPFSENYFFENTDVHGDQKLRRFIPHALLDTMVLRRTSWFSEQEYGFKGIAAGAADIVRKGGRVCLGGHGQLQGLGCHWELWALQSGGMTTHEALRCATLFGAEAIGLQQDLGSIETGKLADLIVLDRNPLDDIHNTNTIRYVMKNGELFVGDTLEQVWPVQKKLPPQYWMDDDPPGSAALPPTSREWPVALTASLDVSCTGARRRPRSQTPNVGGRNARTPR
jgi:Tol biopolymer transport system component/imidazolonepropionase-like amidohydrolase